VTRPVFVVTGPSGAGKGTLISMILPRFPQLRETVSATTRPRRAGEEDGVDYWFLSDDEFERRVQAGEFLEWVSYVGNRYGTLRSEVDRIRADDGAALLELETKGALAVKDEIPGAVTIFVTAPIEELERRLHERATESMGEIDERLAMARDQKLQAEEFHCVVLNDDLDRASAELEGVVRGELEAVGRLSRT